MSHLIGLILVNIFSVSLPNTKQIVQESLGQVVKILITQLHHR